MIAAVPSGVVVGLVVLAGSADLPTCPAGAALVQATTPDAREARCEAPDGERDGARWAWYPSGQLWFQGEYTRGKRTGVWKFWYPSGAAMATGTYRDDKADGDFVRYHEGGQKELAGRCRDGKEEGAWARYWPNGKNAVSVTFRDGKAQGPLQLYSRRGALIDEAAYVREKAPGAAPGSERYKKVLDALRPDLLFQECRG